MYGYKIKEDNSFKYINCIVEEYRLRKKYKTELNVGR